MKSLFNDIKRSGCLVRLRPSMSLGKGRGCSKALARMVACLLWDSQSVASQEMGAFSTSSRRAQERCPQRNSASSRLSTNLAFLSLGSLVFFYCLAPFWGPTSPSSKSSTILFFLKLGLAFSLRSVGSWGGGGGRLGGTWVLGASFKVNPLFLLANRPFKPILYFRSIPSSSSSKLVVTWATINFGGWAVENLSISVSEFESYTGLSSTPSSSSKQNFSISSSRDKREDAISSSTIAAWGGTCWSGIANGGVFCRIGNMTGGRLSRARKSSFDTLILANRGSPTLMACPIS